jgi:hypothetical protein
MTHVLRWLTRQAVRTPVIANMMFHSSELLAGASPYNASANDVAAFLDRIQSSLKCARGLGFTFATLSAAARNVLALS